jgi:UPF0176 protein
MSTVLNMAAYRFVAIEQPGQVVERVRALCQALELKGTVLVAPEGVNLFLAGEPASILDFLEQFGQDRRFAGLPVKYSESPTVPFRRLRVRLKREIISFRIDGIAPARGRAPALAPERLREWLRQGRDDQGRELVLLDTRNQEEVVHGSFAGALSLPIDRFTDLPAAVAVERDRLRDKTVVSFCTGGIRCEKAALWMGQAGYENVWQLDGGILGYFEQVGAEGWSGRCFVFDDRVALDPELQPLGA